jgi:glycine hydroxymethyltransferase
LEHVILAKAICAEEALRPSFKEYIEQVVSNAKEMADTFVELGYDVVTGGTNTHLFLIDFSKTHPDLTGRAV